MRSVLPCPIADPAQGLSYSSERSSHSGAFRNSWCDCRSGGAGCPLIFRPFS